MPVCSPCPILFQRNSCAWWGQVQHEKVKNRVTLHSSQIKFCAINLSPIAQRWSWHELPSHLSRRGQCDSIVWLNRQRIYPVAESDLSETPLALSFISSFSALFLLITGAGGPAVSFSRMTFVSNAIMGWCIQGKYYPGTHTEKGYPVVSHLQTAWRSCMRHMNWQVVPQTPRKR